MLLDEVGEATQAKARWHSDQKGTGLKPAVIAVIFPDLRVVGHKYLCIEVSIADLSFESVLDHIHDDNPRLQFSEIDTPG